MYGITLQSRAKPFADAKWQQSRKTVISKLRALGCLFVYVYELQMFVSLNSMSKVHKN